MKLLLFDDHKLLAESLAAALSENEAVSQCDFVCDETAFYKQIAAEHYDFLLLDINLKNAAKANGFEILAELRKNNRQVQIVILSSYDMPLYRKKALELGALDFINKSLEVSELIERLKRLEQNKAAAERDEPADRGSDFKKSDFENDIIAADFKDEGYKSAEFKDPALHPDQLLSCRELEILRAVCTGKKKKDLSKELYISERTLYNHLQNIYAKLGVENSLEAYNKAIALGYIEPLM